MEEQKEIKDPKLMEAEFEMVNSENGEEGEDIQEESEEVEEYDEEEKEQDDSQEEALPVNDEDLIPNKDNFNFQLNNTLLNPLNNDSYNTEQLIEKIIPEIKLSSKKNQFNNILEENLLANKIEKVNVQEDDDNNNNFLNKINKIDLKTNKTNFLFLFALGFHAIFEGISIGASNEYKILITLLIGLLADKWAEGLSLGITLVKSNIKFKNYLIMIIIFSLMSPIGILIGLLATLSESKIIEAIFLGITSGTFIYISICDILIEEFIEEESNNKNIKFLFFILGGIFIFFLNLYEHFYENE